MKQYILILMIATSIASCSKEAPRVITPGNPVEVENPEEPIGPEMNYINLNDRSISYGGLYNLDLNADGTTDFSFKTLHIGDAVNQVDKIQFLVSSTVNSQLLIDNRDSTMILKKGDPIKPQQNGYTWYNVASLVLAQQNIPVNGDISWQGAWFDVKNQYMPVQVKKNGQLYNGWIEVSMDLELNRIILHKAAISKKAGIIVIAGV